MICLLTPQYIANPAHSLPLWDSNCFGGSGDVGQSEMQVVIRHIHVCNVTAGAATFSMWVGTGTTPTTAGTEYIKQQSVPAHGTWDLYCMLEFNPGEGQGIGPAMLCETGASTLVVMMEGDANFALYNNN
jgi:hypothetical protein